MPGENTASWRVTDSPLNRLYFGRGGAAGNGGGAQFRFQPGQSEKREGGGTGR